MKTYWDSESYEQFSCDWCHDTNDDNEFFLCSGDTVCRKCLERETYEDDNCIMSLEERNADN